MEFFWEMLSLQETMFLLILTGVLIKKLKIIDAAGRKMLSDLLIDVILPVTELDRANQIFERMLYQEPARREEQAPQREREKPAQERAGALQERQEPGKEGGAPGPQDGPCRPASGGAAKKRFSVGTRLARYKNQLLYIQRERNYQDDA